MTRVQQIVPLLQETWSEFQEDEVGQLGAALAYYAVFSIFPLLILLLSVLGFFLDSADTQAQILQVVSQNFSNDPQLLDALREIMNRVANQANTAGIIGLVTLLLGASGVFAQLDMTFNKIWDVPKPDNTGGIIAAIKTTLTQRLFSFGMVLAVSFLLLVSLALTGVTQALLAGAGELLGWGQGSRVAEVLGFVAGLALTLALNTLIFALLFKFLPDTRVEWRDVLLGAFLTAIIWEIAKRLLAIYIGRSSYTSAYGAIGTVLVLMVWIFFSSQILFLGAEFTKVYARRHGSRQPQAAAPEPPTAEPALAPTPRPVNASAAAATGVGAGLLIGAIGGAFAGVAAVILGARRAISAGMRRGRRG